ncbi:MAG: hypothetical protein ACT4QG_14980 [Sporichthyaceae bacterium]
MMKIGVGWAAGVLTGALAVGGITAAAIQVNGGSDNCSGAACVAAGDKSAANAANSASKAALAAAQTKLKTATAGVGGASTDVTKSLVQASGLLDSTSALGGSGVAASQKELEKVLAKQLGIITSALGSADKIVSDFQSGKVSATDLAKVYNTVNGQLKTAKKEIDLVFSAADAAMKLAEKQGAAALGLGSQYRGLLKTAKGQVDKIYKSANTEFKGAFGTVSNALSLSNGVAGLPAIPGATDALKLLPTGDPLKTVTDATKGLPTQDVTKVVDDVKKNLPIDLGKTLDGVPIVGGTVGGLLGGNGLL